MYVPKVRSHFLPVARRLLQSVYVKLFIACGISSTVRYKVIQAPERIIGKNFDQIAYYYLGNSSYMVTPLNHRRPHISIEIRI